MKSWKLNSGDWDGHRERILWHWLRISACFVSVLMILIVAGCVVSPYPTGTEVREGKICIFVGGNASTNGYLWFSAGTSLATLVDQVGMSPEVRSHKVVIIRNGPDGKLTKTTFRLDKMRREEEEKVLLQHGDEVIFARDRCFGFAPGGVKIRRLNNL